MLERFFHRHDHYRRGLFVIDGKPSLEFRIVANPCSPVHTISLIHSWHEENQADTRVLNKVFESINPIVAATIWYEQGPTVLCNFDEARLVALRRAVKALW